MSERRLVDTNVIIRHLVQDNEKLAKSAGKLFNDCDRGELILIILPAVLGECVFVLESFYTHPRPKIARVLRDLISSPGVEIPDLEIHMDALLRFERTRLHFVDCVLAAHAAGGRIAVATFDREFKKFTDVCVTIKKSSNGEW